MLAIAVIIWGLIGLVMPVCALGASPAPAPFAGEAGATVVPNAHVTPAAVREFENGIPVGTKITLSNWQQYKAFMPDGMIQLFQGSNFWKMPPDVEMNVG